MHICTIYAIHEPMQSIFWSGGGVTVTMRKIFQIEKYKKIENVKREEEKRIRNMIIPSESKRRKCLTKLYYIIE